MPRFHTATLSRYLLHGQLSSETCLSRNSRVVCRPIPTNPKHACLRTLHTETTYPRPAAPAPAHVPLRKQLKDEARRQRVAGKETKKKKNANNQVIDGWELTVGLEIHAQLNTAKKLFSSATTSFRDDPNSHVAYFDLAIPGSQPVFQQETLVPALRAALALNCHIQPVSRFDRKHYFHWDQPSGYQITQYYEPLARDGSVTLQPRDGIALEDGDGLVVGIKQIQMEQDTAKTTSQPGEVHWIDYNRVGAPLIEIITLPEIHYPATAAALVRKIQMLLDAVDACVSGMEAGGLRADVNVSVRKSDDLSVILGQRTEIKNLSSFKAVEDAIIAERDRQIAILEAGGTIAGETRGWSIGSSETRRLRGKEGEVDYRYMPDPDVAPIVVGSDLLHHLRDSMGELPDAQVDGLVRDFGLTAKDALSLVALDGGMRIEYFWNVVDALATWLGGDPGSLEQQHIPCYQLAANWILHELGRLTSNRSELAGQELGFTEGGQCERIRVAHLADIVFYLHQRKITAKIAKELLWVTFRGRIPEEYPTVLEAIERENLWFHELSDAEYLELANKAIEGQEDVVRHFVDYKQYPQGKLMFLVGRMIRLGQEERIDPKNAERVMRGALEEKYVPAVKEEEAGEF